MQNVISMLFPFVLLAIMLYYPRLSVASGGNPAITTVTATRTTATAVGVVYSTPTPTETTTGAATKIITTATVVPATTTTVEVVHTTSTTTISSSTTTTTSQITTFSSNVLCLQGVEQELDLLSCLNGTTLQIFESCIMELGTSLQAQINCSLESNVTQSILSCYSTFCPSRYDYISHELSNTTSTSSQTSATMITVSEYYGLSKRDATVDNCGLRCPPGQVAVTNPGTCPTWNGCGTATGFASLIPNLWFAQACNCHDSCYDMCGNTFASCNKAILRNMLQICANTYAS